MRTDDRYTIGKKSIFAVLILLSVLFSFFFSTAAFAATGKQSPLAKPRTFTIFRDTGAIVEHLPAGSLPQKGWTNPVPASYFTETAKKGTVERISYSSKDYAGEGEGITKTAYVYLPYGYDPKDKNKRYNIFYMMHGLECTADQLFNEGGGKAKNMLDHMIESGDIPPVIVVAATFDADNSPQDFIRSESEVRQFHNDFANHLMPAVEGQYHTYAASASKKDLMASRDHRAFGGFSLGAVTTWFEFCYNYDFIHYYAPMSASCWYFGGYGDYQAKKTCDFFEKLIRDHDLNNKGYYIYACTGTNDSLFGQMNAQMNEMLSRSTVFTPEHVVYYLKNGGIHDFNSSVEYIYNALPVFFKR